MKKYWITKDGKRLPIKKMETSHIRNCIKYLEKNPIEYGSYDPFGNDHFYDIDYEQTDDYIQAFEMELLKRSK
jgi:hypothetical protein